MINIIVSWNVELSGNILWFVYKMVLQFWKEIFWRSVWF